MDASALDSEVWTLKQRTNNKTKHRLCISVASCVLAEEMCLDLSGFCPWEDTALLLMEFHASLIHPPWDFSFGGIFSSS